MLMLRELVDAFLQHIASALGFSSYCYARILLDEWDRVEMYPKRML